MERDFDKPTKQVVKHVERVQTSPALVMENFDKLTKQVVKSVERVQTSPELLDFGVIRDVANEMGVFFSRENLFLLPKIRPLTDAEESIVNGLWRLLTRQTISLPWVQEGKWWPRHATPYFFVIGWDLIWDVAKANGQHRYFWRDAYHWCERTLALAHANLCINFGRGTWNNIFNSGHWSNIPQHIRANFVNEEWTTSTTIRTAQLWDYGMSVSLAKSGGTGADPSLAEKYCSVPIIAFENQIIRRHDSSDYGDLIDANAKAPTSPLARPFRRYLEPDEMLAKSRPGAMESTLRNAGYTKTGYLGTLLFHDLFTVYISDLPKHQRYITRDNYLYALNVHYATVDKKDSPFVDAVVAMSLCALDPFATMYLLEPRSWKYSWANIDISPDEADKAGDIVDRRPNTLLKRSLKWLNFVPGYVEMDRLLLNFAYIMEGRRLGVKEQFLGINDEASVLKVNKLNERLRGMASEIAERMPTHRFIIQDHQGYIGYKASLNDS